MTSQNIGIYIYIYIICVYAFGEVNSWTGGLDAQVELTAGKGVQLL